MEWQIAEVEETESTNADLLAAAAEGAPEGTVRVTSNQSAGRGRLDRTWQIPPGTGLAFSALVRPRRPVAEWSWLPLIAGLAAMDAVRGLGIDATLKWPNDVLVDGRKLAGILVESAGEAAVIGVGLNVSMTEGQLPVPAATSLALEGVTATPRGVAEVLTRRLEAEYTAWNGGGDIRQRYATHCATIGQLVRLTAPNGDIEGIAQDIDASGRLVVDGRPISAGDVTHVRPAGA